VQNSRQLEAGPSTSSSYSLKSLERLLQDTSVLSVNPALFASVHLREGYSAELMVRVIMDPISHLHSNGIFALE